MWQVCQGGSCDPGTDLLTCARQLYATCEDEVPQILSECNGHADPYHYHEDLVCHNDVNATAQHSPVLAIANDGRGIYGRHEGAL